MLRFVTSNEGKIREAREYLPEDVKQVEYDYPEIQSNHLKEIAAAGARDAYREIDGPVFVDDSGLFIDAFSGFPGPYSSYVEEKLGIERVQELTEREKDHRARFRAVVAYADSEVQNTSNASSAERRSADRASGQCPQADGDEPRVGVETFEGAVRGRIVAPRGSDGFGYDPIFEHRGRTFAEMRTEEKNAVSHRGRALAKFGDWLAERA